MPVDPSAFDLGDFSFPIGGMGAGTAVDIHSPSDILRSLIVSLAMASYPTNNSAWPAFTGREPSTPDNVVTCYDTIAGNEERKMTGAIINHPGVQVRVRSTDHKTGYSKAYNIRAALSESVNKTTITIDSTTYLVQAVTNISPILALGKGPTDVRSLFTINMILPYQRLV